MGRRAITLRPFLFHPPKTVSSTKNHPHQPNPSFRPKLLTPFVSSAVEKSAVVVAVVVDFAVALAFLVVIPERDLLLLLSLVSR
jgi:hypothetical protein